MKKTSPKINPNYRISNRWTSVYLRLKQLKIFSGKFLRLEFIYIFVLIAVISAFFIRLFIPHMSVIATHEIGINDIWDIYYPFKQILHDSLAQGNIPLWTEMVSNGFPLHGEGQIGIFNIFNLILFKFLNPMLAFNLGIVTSFIICALGAYLFLRQVGFDSAISLCISTVFSLSGFFVVRISHYALLQSASYIPLLFYLTDRFFNRIQKIAGVIFALVLSQQIFSGHTQMVFISLMFLVLYGFYLAYVQKKDWFRFLTFLYWIFNGFILSAVFILPVWELTTVSQRSEGISPSEIMYYKFPFMHFLTFLNPFWFGNPQMGSYPHFNKIDGSIFWENTGYIGLIPLVLAFIGFIFFSFKSKIFWLMVLIFSGLLMLGGAGPLYFLLSMSPFNFFRFPSRYIVIFVLSVLIFAAGGFKFIRLKIRNINIKRTVTLTIFIISIFDLFHVFYYYHPLVSAEKFFMTPLVVRKLNQLGFERVWVNKANMRTFSEFENTKPGKTERYFELRNDLVPNSNIIWNIPSAAFYSSFAPKRLFYLSAFFENPYSEISSESATISTAGLRMLSIRNTDAILSPIKLKNNSLSLIDTVKLPVFSDQYTYIYKNNEVLPFVYAYNQTKLVTSPDELNSFMFKRDFGIKNIALVESQNLQISGNKNIKFDVNNFKKENNSFSFRITLNQKALVTIASTYYPGWIAYVDGKKKSVSPINLVNTGLLISKGNHIVRFLYDPYSYRLGLAISIFGYIFLFSLLFYFQIKNK